MTTTSLFPVFPTGGDATAMPAGDPGLMAEMLAPRLTERPAPCPDIRVPRSARRTYTYDERCAAAELMMKLRRREDCRPLAAAAVDGDAGHAVDVAVDRLLLVL